MNRRRIIYNVKLIAVSAGMLIFAFKIQAIGGQCRTEKIIQPELISGTSLEKVIEKQVLQSFVYYEVPEGELTEETQRYIFSVCNQYDIAPEVVLSIIEQESNFNHTSIGDSGKSFGYMQIMQKWHLKRMERLGVTDLLDPKENVLVGIDYLVELSDEFHDLHGLLMAYNCGPTRARELMAQGIYQTDYSQKVLTRAEEIRQELYGGKKDEAPKFYREELDIHTIWSTAGNRGN